MRSQQAHEKVWGEIKINNVTVFNRTTKKNIIGILLYNSFIEIPGSNQTFEENKDTLNSSGHVKQEEKNMLHNAYPASTWENLWGN